MSVAFLCPGQGAQTPGFLHRLPDAPEVATTLDEASEVLGHEVRRLDGAEALRSTVAVQLATVVAGVATGRALAARGAVPDLVAGLSVGAFTAAVLSGALTLPDGLRIVRLRGEEMQRAFPRGHGLAAVVGLDERRVAALAAASVEDPAYVANLNAPTQLVLAGSDAALEDVIGRALAAGASRAERLAVDVPSHSPLLAGVGEVLAAALRTVPVTDARVPYVTNARARDPRPRGRPRGSRPERGAARAVARGDCDPLRARGAALRGVAARPDADRARAGGAPACARGCGRRGSHGFDRRARGARAAGTLEDRRRARLRTPRPGGLRLPPPGVTNVGG